MGVIGVMECNFLDPTHNKQSFIETEKYRCGHVHLIFCSSGLACLGLVQSAKSQRKLHIWMCVMILEGVFCSDSKTIASLGIKLEDYWNEIRHKRTKENPNSIPVEDAELVHVL